MKTNLRTVCFFVAVSGLILCQGCATAEQHVRVQPQVIFQARPEYPMAMRQANIAGEVMVDFLVNQEGIPRNLYPLKSSRREFEPAAVAAVAKWRFKPGTVDGRSVVTHMAVPIVFALDEK